MRGLITRNLAEDSPFKQRMAASDLQITGISLIAFLPTLSEPLPEVDWLFFYSKNGVKFFFEQKRIALPSTVKIAAMGASTAKTLAWYGHTTDFVGKGKPTHIANAFQQVATGQKVAFLRAKHSKKSVQEIVKDHLQVVDRVVYENRPIHPCCLPFFDILIFTSPLNVKTYFRDNSYQSFQVIFSIGPTTTQALKQVGIENIITASASSEAALVESVLQFLRTK